MLTARHDMRIWSTELLKVFSHSSPTESWFNLCSRLYMELQSIRKLRIRIAHHEPVYTRDLQKDFQMIHGIVALRSVDATAWLLSNQDASAQIAQPPTFRGGQNWQPEHGIVSNLAYQIWKSREPAYSPEENWYSALRALRG